MCVGGIIGVLFHQRRKCKRSHEVNGLGNGTDLEFMLFQFSIICFHDKLSIYTSVKHLKCPVDVVTSDDLH